MILLNSCLLFQGSWTGADAEHMYEKYVAKAMSEVENLNAVENLPEEYRSMIPAEML